MSTFHLTQEIACGYCGRKVRPKKQFNSAAKYCSVNCRNMAYRARKAAGKTSVTQASSPPYETTFHAALAKPSHGKQVGSTSLEEQLFDLLSERCQQNRDEPSFFNYMDVFLDQQRQIYQLDFVKKTHAEQFHALTSEFMRRNNIDPARNLTIYSNPVKAGVVASVEFREKAFTEQELVDFYQFVVGSFPVFETTSQ